MTDAGRDWGRALRADARAGWAAIRAAVVAAEAGQLPDVLAAVNWAIEVECHGADELQRTVRRWMDEEAAGADFGAPTPDGLTSLRREAASRPGVRPGEAARAAELLARGAVARRQIEELTAARQWLRPEGVR